MAFPQTPLQVIVELAIDGVWTDITADTYTRNPITINRGRPDEASRVDPASCTLTLNNRHGRYSPRSPHSPYFGLLGRNTPARVSVVLADGSISYRFTGEVASWPQHWDVSGNDVWTTVQASGIMRRLGQGAPPLRDALRRAIEAGGPLAYWPLNDGEDAVDGAEVVEGAKGIHWYNLYENRPVEWTKGDLAPWLTPVVAMPSESTGDMAVKIRPHAEALGGWSVDFVRYGIGSSESWAFWGVSTGSDPVVRWDVNIGSDLDPEIDIWCVTVDEGAVNSTFLATVTTESLFTDEPHHLRLSVAPDGAGGSEWTLHLDGQQLSTGTHAVPVQYLGKLYRNFSTTDPNGDTGPLYLGHVTYWGPEAPDEWELHAAMLGHQRELAGRRIERVCAEQGVPLQVHGNLDKTPPMGPQKPGAFLDVLNAAATVDGGVLGEARDDLALSYRTRASRYRHQGVTG